MVKRQTMLLLRLLQPLHPKLIPHWI